MTPDQRSLVGLADEIMRARTSHEDLAVVEESASRVDERLYRQLAEAGITGVAIPEIYGGTGLGLTELCLVLEAQGRHLAPVPLWESCLLGGLALMKFGTPTLAGDLLGGVSDGSLTLTAALDLTGSDPISAHEGRLSGCAFVQHGAANAVVVAAGDGLYLANRAALDGRVVETTTWALAADIDFTGVQADPLAGPGSVGWLADRARVGLAAVQLGVADAGVRAAAAYLSARE
ncbi:MAG: acyl-CoA dehydrogenase family protein, partial [Actinomycetota bacterium]|nr:acyl-CoA dehydrogenase family protein [Actinomycetota bacterium]